LEIGDGAKVGKDKKERERREVSGTIYGRKKTAMSNFPIRAVSYLRIAQAWGKGGL